MTNPAVAEAMSAALSDVAPTSAPPSPESSVPARPSGNAVDSKHGPLTAEQAEKLLAKALKAAKTFADVMREIVDRRAWEPLGYASPREMMRDRFTGKLTNPRTGKPFDDSYIRRMSNVAWVLWEISDSTGVQASDLNIAGRLLAQIPGGYDGEHHDELVETILQEVQRRGATSSDEVQEVIDATLAASAENRAPTAPPVEEVAERSAGDTAAYSTPGGAEAASMSLTPAQSEDGPGQSAPEAAQAAAPGGQAPQRDGMRDRYGESAGDEDDWQDQAPASSATEAFDADFAPGALAPQGGVSMGEAIEMMRKTEKVASDISSLSGFPGELASAVAKINETVPAMVAAVEAVVTAAEAVRDTGRNEAVAGLFDSLSEEEIAELFEQAERAVEVVPVVETAAQVLDAVATEHKELPEAGDISKAGDASGSAADALANLEEFIDELDFLSGGY